MNSLKATTIVAAAYTLRLQRWDSDTLAAIYHYMQAFGEVTPGSPVYKPALEAGFINADGRPVDLDSIQMAASHEIMRRVEARTF